MQKKEFLFGVIIAVSAALFLSANLQAMLQERAEVEQNVYDDEQKVSVKAVESFDSQLEVLVQKGSDGHYWGVDRLRWEQVLLNERALWRFLPQKTQKLLQQMYCIGWLDNASQYLATQNNPAGKALFENLKEVSGPVNAEQRKACQVAYLKELIKQLPGIGLWKFLKPESRRLLEDFSPEELDKISDRLCRDHNPSFYQVLMSYLLQEQESDSGLLENRDSREAGYVLALMKEKNKEIDERAAYIQKVRENRYPNWLLISGYLAITGIFIWPITAGFMCK